MKDLLILGTGVHAVEMVEIVDRVNRAEQTWNLLGFITAKEELVGQELNGYPVLGTLDKLTEFPDVCFVPDNAWSRSIEVHRERLVSLIDPSAFVSRTAQIGAGCVLYPNCYVGLRARIGDYVFCLSGCVINHDDVIEDRVVMASGAKLAGGVHVEADCYLGQASTCKQFIRIGRNSMIGMSAVVVKDVPPNSVMVGNPARKLKDREPEK